MNIFHKILPALAALCLPACVAATKAYVRQGGGLTEALTDTFVAVTAEYPAEIGIAVITDDGDTVTVNNRPVYPLMSVFKLHQALALCDMFDRRAMSLDTLLTIQRTSLNEHTWSPMLRDIPSGDLHLTVRQLLEYSVQQSDNNASNYLFNTFQPVAAVDSFAATVIPRESFRLGHTEAQMFNNHALCYDNRTSPLGAAMLIDRLFTDSIFATADAAFVREALAGCRTGDDRIVAPLKDIPGVTAAHKTGSGFSERGILAAHNDVAFVSLPDGRHYSIAVFVKDFRGDETAAAKAIARISAIVYGFVAGDTARLQDKRRAFLSGL